MTFTSTDYYRRNRLTRAVVYSCPECEYDTTGSRIQLQNHIHARHTREEERPYQCAHCERGFAQRSHLMQHLKRIHDIEAAPRPKVSSIGYIIELTRKRPKSKKTAARRAYYASHSLIKSREINENKHEYLAGVYLKQHDIHYDANKGFIRVRKCELVGTPHHIPGPRMRAVISCR